jgi:hypothetical protein
MLYAAKWFLALFAATGLASFATADEPKGPDLSDLRDAVKAASKRGENVSEIAKALNALEKFVARGWAGPKSGTISAPPELTALRDAVETALKKGENVEAISKELQAVEKAMTGQAFVRPDPQPPVDPPAIQPAPGYGRPNIVIRGGRGEMVLNGMQLGGRDGVSMSITINNDNFTLKASHNGVQYALSGTLAADGPALDKVTITDGEKKPMEFKNLKDVPEDYKPTVEKLLNNISFRRRR